MKKSTIYILATFFFLTLNVKSQISKSLYLLGGVSTFEEQFDGREILYYPKPAGGIGFGINLPLKKKFSLSSGLNLQVKSGGYHYIEQLNEYTYEQKTTVSIMSFSIPISLQYNIPFKNSAIQVGAGGYLGMNIYGAQSTSLKLLYPNSENYNYSYTASMSWAKFNEEPNPGVLKRIDFGYYFSIDYQYKRFIIGINSEIGKRNISSTPSHELKFTTYSLMGKIGFKIKKKKKEPKKRK